MPSGSSDAGSFLEMGPFRLFLFINFKPLVYTNLFFATAVMSCKALRKGFF